MTRIFRCLAIMFMVLSLPLALAQDYPAKPIRFIVGPGPDVVARLIGQKLTDQWGQQVVVDQRPGAGGVIALELVAKAAPDGYTILLSTGSNTSHAALYPKLPYNLDRGLAPVTLLSKVSYLVVVNPAVPAKSMAELIQLARAKPGQINCAHSGIGTTVHFGCELLKASTGIDIVSVPYKATAAALIEVIGGQAQLMYGVMQATLPYVQSGKLRALAVTGAGRKAALPELPTITEAGAPGADLITWNGVHVPAATPRALIAKLNVAIVRLVRLPEISERMLSLGLDPVGDRPEEFGALVKSDIARWTKVIRIAGIQVE